jgi:hypothetical protein
MSDKTAPAAEETEPTNAAPTPTPEDVAIPDLPPVDEGILGGALFGNIEELLNKLVPKSDVVIKDCWGNEISLPSALPARRQIKVFRIFKEIAAHESITGTMAATGATLDAGVLIDLVMQVASDDEVSELLGKAFAEAHPDALDGKDPLDVLPVEEILAGLVPFFVRFLQRGVAAMGSLSQMMPQA